MSTDLVFQRTPYAGGSVDLVFGGEAAPPTSRLKYWDGAAWVPKTLKYWDGAAWVPKAVKYWGGSTWGS